MKNTKITPTKIETDFPPQKEDNNDANESKVILLEPVHDQPAISDAQRAEKQVATKSVTTSQLLSQKFEQ